MPRRLSSPNEYGGTTDHSDYIEAFRVMAEASDGLDAIELRLAADLLEAHDQTGISLDDWPNARRFVEVLTGVTVIPNGV